MFSHRVVRAVAPGLRASLAARSGSAARPRRAGARGALLAELDRRRRPEPERHLGDPAERRVDLGERHPVDREVGDQRRRLDDLLPRPHPVPPRLVVDHVDHRRRRLRLALGLRRERRAAVLLAPEDHRERRLPARRDRPTLLHQLARSCGSTIATMRLTAITLLPHARDSAGRGSPPAVRSALSPSRSPSTTGVGEVTRLGGPWRRGPSTGSRRPARAPAASRPARASAAPPGDR